MRIFLLFLFLAPLAKAHPVIYKDGFVYWGEFSSQENTQILSYTFHPNFALQLSSDFEKYTGGGSNKSVTYQLGLNVLIKRWFLENSQANIYTSFQSGVFTDEISGIYKDGKRTKFPIKDRLTFQWNLSADWESRFIYTAGGIKLKGRSSSINEALWGDFYYRIGFAPYIAGMDTLQTWFVLMFQASAAGTVNKDMRDYFLKEHKEREFPYRTSLITDNLAVGINWKITPLLRFFYKNVLWEIGSSLQSDFYLTLMLHY
ncbi:MAG: hypothetical protein OXK80_03125 [Bdellovibrionales bacterium]|nr:hypothetical protein [Bdellovibrionales bacterium]